MITERRNMNTSHSKNNLRHRTKIDAFIFLATPIVAYVVDEILRSAGCEIEVKGNRANIVFCIKHGDKDIQFHLHNLLFEIASIDRDERPLRFDENLTDFDYFVAKTNRLINSKLAILFEVLFEKDFEKARENIAKLGDQYERIRIWEIDPEKHQRPRP
jgi:hypothetical protein